MPCLLHSLMLMLWLAPAADVHAEAGPFLRDPLRWSRVGTA